MAFIDETKFFVKGGDGGRGCVSFRREKFVPRGGPDGGDGGNGGSVIIVATKRLLSLLDFRYCSHFVADKGTHGKGKKMHGKRGQDKILQVPLGSIIKDAETGHVIADLTEEGERVVVAPGGRGGAGNVHFATGQNRTPRRAGKGVPGEEQWLIIELKLIADVGLVGLPNAGKSTLLSKLSAANPKISPYPFTTLEPKIGILHLEFREPCIIADIPGLIEGAHTGAGLGHKFLRHVERTKILVHILDAGELEAQPLEDFNTIENELRCYNDELLSRKRLIVINKIDLIDDQQLLNQLLIDLGQTGLEVFTISALEGDGIEQLKDRFAEIMDEIDENN
jgi:GTP-binding protein